MAQRLVYYFGNGEADGGREDKDLLGGKGANLAEMVRIGLPVPPGFTITTEACRHYLAQHSHPPGLHEEVEANLRRLEKDTGKSFGGGEEPLLLSVRSGAAASMPGMMDTILNLGLNDRTASALAISANDERFAYDSYRRFVQMYGSVVLGIPAADFEGIISRRKSERGVADDTGLGAEDLNSMVVEFKRLVEERTGVPFPDDPEDQLWGAIAAVFDSWDNDRAISYRRVNRIPADLGTAVSVVTMVYGNMGEDSGTGVAFTRSPSTGARKLFGEFLVNAQGEDVVAGIRDPLDIDGMAEALPDAFRELRAVQETLERHYRDVQDLEFTVEGGKLYLLQTRTAKRTAAAAVKIAVDMVEEGLIDEPTAVLRVDPESLDQLLHPRVDPDADPEVLAVGLPASPGAASGRVVFDSATARDRAAHGEAVILVREETSPDDFDGMVASRGILTARGGMTSHAAVVARGIGKCCIVGARDLEVHESAGHFRVHGHTVREGDQVTLDGSSGRVLLGEVATVESEMSADYHRLMEWADRYRTMRVRTNADTPRDAMKARENGAEGIGLCRTEHMFFERERLGAMREMILADDEEGRREALRKLLPMQRQDFFEIFRAMDGLPVTIRLLDPPLHEFLPRTEAELRALSRSLHVPKEELRDKVARHRESNPMLGHRGVRLGTTFPEITEVQAFALFEAAVRAIRDGIDVRPEVMIPLVATVDEFRGQRRVVDRTAERVRETSGVGFSYLVGTMIELPRAALTAGEIAAEADFFSFGTNDLTQTTFGISRDDSGTFLPFYLENGVLPDDPFQCIDRAGVGRLVEIATREGRAARLDLKVGICGEHGGEPRSVYFFHEIGLDYVSCSPFRVPVARLAAARAALLEERTVGRDGREIREGTEAEERGTRKDAPTARSTAGPADGAETGPGPGHGGDGGQVDAPIAS